MRRLIVILATAVATIGLAAAPAAADDCSGKTRPYDERGRHEPTPTYTLQYGSASDPFAGYYYTDGYLFVDGNTARHNGNGEVRTFTPMWPAYADARIVVGPDAGGSCVHAHLAYLDWFDWVFETAGQEPPPAPFDPIDVKLPPR